MKNLINVLFAILLISGCNKSENDVSKDIESKNPEKEKSDYVILTREAIGNINLETKTISTEQYTDYLKIPAVVVTDQNYEAQVSSIVSGRIKSIFVSTGSFVRAGQTLMLIEGLEIGVLKADFMKSKVSLSYAEQEYNRQKYLAEQNAGSQKNFLSAKVEYEKALAEYNAMDKKIHSIGLDDDDIINEKDDVHTAGNLAIKAPLSGMIVERNVVVGQHIEPSSVAFKILNTKSLYVDGQIYESDLYKLEKNSSLEFRTTSFPNDIFTCKVIYRGQIIDEKSRTLKIRAKINNPGNKLIPQMFGEMILKVTQNKIGYFIQSSAIFKLNDKSYVFICENDTTFKKVEIKTGVEHNEKTEVTSGLNSNDIVVINGVFELKSELLKETFSEGE